MYCRTLIYNTCSLAVLQEDMEVGMQVMRNELAVNEEHLKNQVKQWAKQRTQWQQLAIALQR